MSELATILEEVGQQIHIEPGGLDRIRDRQRRRERNQKLAMGLMNLGAVSIALVVAAVVIRLTLPGQALPVIDSGGASRLAPAWSHSFDGAGASSVVVADGIVYLVSDDGRIYAVDARTGDVRWTAAIPIGTATAPVVADGTVLVNVGGKLTAFDVGCASNGEDCQPRWSSAIGGTMGSSPVIADGVAYVVNVPGGVTAVDLSCATSSCTPLWSSNESGVYFPHEPAIGGGAVWDSSSNALSAFPVDCGTANANCQPLVEGLRPDGIDLSSGPAIADGVLYVGASDGTVYALSTSCAATGSCDPLWRAQTGGSVAATPVVANGHVYVASNDGNLYAFPTSCGANGSCSAAWIGRTGGAVAETPLVANGVVYVASTDGHLYAFAESCGTSGSDCAPLLVEPTGALPVGPGIWDGRVVYVMSADGTLTAYTVGGSMP